MFENKKAAMIEFIKKDAPKPDIAGFSDFLDLQQDWFDYKTKPLIFSARLQYNSFLIREKLLKTTQNHIEIVTGKIGKGKTTLAWQRCCAIDPTFNIKRFIYTYEQLLYAIITYPRGSAFCIDEGGDLFSRVDAITSDGKKIIKKFQKLRFLGFYFAICFDDIEKIMDTMLSRTDSVLEKIYNPKAQYESDKFRGVKLYGADLMDSIRLEVGKKRKSLQAIRRRAADSHNTEHRPMINELSEEAYDALKSEHIVEEARREWEEMQSKKQTETVSRPTPELIKLSEARKILPLSHDTFKARISSGEIRGKRIGVMYYVYKDDVLSLAGRDFLGIASSDKGKDSNNNTEGRVNA